MVTAAVLALFAGFTSRDVVPTVAVLFNAVLVNVITRTGAVIVMLAPRLTVFSEQTKLVDPAVPVQLAAPLVMVPLFTVTVGVPLSSMPEGSVSDKVTPSPSARPAAVTFSTTMSQLKGRRSAMGLGVAVLLVTRKSALLRTVVLSVTALFAGCGSAAGTATISSDVRLAALPGFIVPFATPFITTVNEAVWPGLRLPRLQLSVPPVVESTAGAPLHAAPAID